MLLTAIATVCWAPALSPNVGNARRSGPNVGNARRSGPVIAGISRRAALAGVGAAGGLGLLPATAAEPEVFSPKQGSLQGRTILITGANTGLGLESAKRLSAAGATVIATARSEAKVAATREAVLAATPGAKVVALQLDLGNLASVKDFPGRLAAAVGQEAPAIDVLMNNAGVMAIPERLTTSDGFERQLGVNHLGHFALVSALLPSLRRARDGFRVINVSSEGHRFATAKSLQAALEQDLDPAEYSQWGNYGLSKAANILFASELQRRIDDAGLRGSAVSMHPGGVATDLGRYLVQGVEAAEAGVPLDQTFASMNPVQKALLKGLAKVALSVDRGANTQVFLAAAADSSGDLAKDGGLYFDDMKPAVPADFTQDARTAKRLWDLSEKLTGMRIVF